MKSKFSCVVCGNVLDDDGAIYLNATDSIEALCKKHVQLLKFLAHKPIDENTTEGTLKLLFSPKRKDAQP